MFLHQQPDAAFARYDAALFDFPLTFAEDFQPRGINHQMCDFTPDWCFKADINGLCALADAGVIRAAQGNVHQGKNGVNKALCSPQGQSKYAFNNQNSGDGKVRITLRPSPG